MTPHAKDTELWINSIRSVCDPKVYLDIGAGDGYDCAQVKAAFPLCRCIAIEPYEAWEVDGGIDKYRDVIGHSDSWHLFHVKTVPGVHGIYSRTAVADQEVVAKPIRTLRHFCAREYIPTIDAMKIDVEGAAWDVIAGAFFPEFSRQTHARRSRPFISRLNGFRSLLASA